MAVLDTAILIDGRLEDARIKSGHDENCEAHASQPELE